MDSMFVFWGSIFLNEVVDLEGIGKTQLLFRYAHASSKLEADELFREWVSKSGWTAKEVTTRLADVQDVSKYTQNHQLITRADI